MHLTPARQRLLTGLCLLAALAALVATGGWPLRLAAALIAALAMWEFMRLYWPDRDFMPRKVLGLAGSVLIVLAEAGGPLWTLAALIFCCLAVFLAFLFNFGSGNAKARLGHYGPLLHGFIYIPLMLQLALSLAPAEQCLVMLAAIATDTGGYYAGTAFGRHKIWPMVSPKKSWEGFCGGLLLCLLCLPLLGLTAQAMAWEMLRLPGWAWLLAAFILNLAALFGDFFESALKRSLNVKDSGALLPGHGGVLDRIDSTLFVIPAYMLIRLGAGLIAGP